MEKVIIKEKAIQKVLKLLSNGVIGPRGYDAYQQALFNGFLGTEEEWLESLRGIDGQDGLNGLSAFQLAQNNGFVGSEEDWLEFIRGIDGIDGKDGEEVILRNDGTYIQWKYTNDIGWTNLVLLEDITGENGLDGNDGRKIELRTNTTHIQYRYDGDVTWTNLIALSTLKGKDGEPGTDGNDGRDNYQIALSNGFVGTEQEYLQSLKGSDGFDGLSAFQLAQNNGFLGTEEEWLDSLKGIPGQSGSDGQEIVLRSDNNFIQYKYENDTDWINLVSLEDLKGNDGEDGIDGREVQLRNDGTFIQWKYTTDATWTNLVSLESLKGNPGIQGNPGVSAYQSAVNNGFVGTEQQWLESLKGKDGTNGATKTTELTDVFNTQPQNNQVLISDGTKYYPGFLNIRQLGDVTSKFPVNHGDTLSYNSTTQKFELVAPTSGGATTTRQLTDVSTTLPNTNELLVFNGSVYTPTRIGLEYLNNVVINYGSIQNNQVLSYDSTANNFQFKTPASLSISTRQLTDVRDSGTPFDRSVLIYNSTLGKYVNREIIMKDLLDLNTFGLTTGQVLTYAGKDQYSNDQFNFQTPATGGGVTTFEALTDVNVANKVDGYVVTYDSPTQKYTLKAPSGGGVIQKQWKYESSFKTLAGLNTFNAVGCAQSILGSVTAVTATDVIAQDGNENYNMRSKVIFTGSTGAGSNADIKILRKNLWRGFTGGNTLSGFKVELAFQYRPNGIGQRFFAGVTMGPNGYTSTGGNPNLNIIAVNSGNTCFGIGTDETYQNMSAIFLGYQSGTNLTNTIFAKNISTIGNFDVSYDDKMTARSYVLTLECLGNGDSVTLTLQDLNNLSKIGSYKFVAPPNLPQEKRVLIPQIWVHSNTVTTASSFGLFDIHIYTDN